MRILTTFISLLICVGLFGQKKDLVTQTKKIVDADYPYLDKLYKHLHANPEISLQEKETSKKLAEELRALGFEVTENFGGYGVVGVLKNGKGPTIMVRTDTDGLPVKEQTNLPYASTVTTKDEKGKTVPTMHACGHDIHMTVWTGVARTLKELKNSWKGTIVMVAQPGEEISFGAGAMLDKGLYDKFPKPDYAIALHANATIPAGKIGYCSGYALANVDMVEISVFGEGGHGAYPHTTKDPIVLASRIVLALQTVVSREVSPLEPAVVTVGAIHGGTKHNIIPDKVELQLTLRSYDDKVRAHTIKALERISKGVAMSAGISEDKMPVVTVRDQSTPATYNDPQLTEKAATSFKRAIGEENVLVVPPVMGGEDFAKYGRTDEKVPVCIYWLGTIAQETVDKSKKEGTSLPSLHSPFFAPLPQPSITTGVVTMTTAILDLLKK